MALLVTMPWDPAFRVTDCVLAVVPFSEPLKVIAAPEARLPLFVVSNNVSVVTTTSVLKTWDAEPLVRTKPPLNVIVPVPAVSKCSGADVSPMAPAIRPLPLSVSVNRCGPLISPSNRNPEPLISRLAVIPTSPRQRCAPLLDTEAPRLAAPVTSRLPPTVNAPVVVVVPVTDRSPPTDKMPSETSLPIRFKPLLPVSVPLTVSNPSVCKVPPSLPVSVAVIGPLDRMRVLLPVSATSPLISLPAFDRSIGFNRSPCCAVTVRPSRAIRAVFASCETLPSLLVITTGPLLVNVPNVRSPVLLTMFAP
ncbi:hypothetical protein MCEGEM3_01990 [Oxalobacteraceae bacterium]